MGDICREVMAHWYNIKDQDYEDYYNKFFDEKWKQLDNSNMG
jgi:hypothetical protein